MTHPSKLPKCYGSVYIDQQSDYVCLYHCKHTMECSEAVQFKVDNIPEVQQEYEKHKRKKRKQA